MLKVQKYNLLLDDIRTVNEVFEMTKDIDYSVNEWIIAKDYHEFIKIIENKYKENSILPETISFDHDIGEDYTGKDCAKWFIDFCIDNKLDISKIKIHSMNPVGKQNIANLFSDYQKYLDSNEIFDRPKKIQ